LIVVVVVVVVLVVVVVGSGVVVHKLHINGDPARTFALTLADSQLHNPTIVVHSG
jgi:hypothetical protein